MEKKFLYNSETANEIEDKWQKIWQENNTYEVKSINTDKKPHYALDMFPYPSGIALHIGHAVSFTPTDVYARFKRMKGYHVLHTMGYDAFGLPAERFAINNNQHPSISTNQNIDTMRYQLSKIGMGYDRNRSISTIDPQFYKWTQWIFTQLFNSYYDKVENKAKPIENLITQFESGEKETESKKAWNELTDKEKYDELAKYRLAFVLESVVNWCPMLGTVLADEEVSSTGKSEIGDFPVYRRALKQWNLRITEYADRLNDDIENLDWPEGIKIMQRNWIGRSKGAFVDFEVNSKNIEDKIRVFTTRPDTLFGTTFLVLAPEYGMIKDLLANSSLSDLEKEEVEKYINDSINKSDVQRQEDEKEKTGKYLGIDVINPANGKNVPIYVGDYVLMNYGTGAVMGVPAHDERDFEFARKFNIEIIPVVEPTKDWLEENNANPLNINTWPIAYIEKGDHTKLINSQQFDGLSTKEGIEKITNWLEEKNCGQETTTYKIRDWLFSRQRYWGEPFPIVWDEDEIAYSLPVDQLPVELPELEDFSPKGANDEDSEPKPPLGNVQEWVNVELDLNDGKGLRKFKREINTMPQWAGSCWYYLRYLDPDCQTAFVSKEVLNYWQSIEGKTELGNKNAIVDMYIGGAEHAIGHLLYSRFWHKVLYDLGHVSNPEPFQRLFNQGMLLASAYKDQRGFYVDSKDVIEEDGKYYYNFENGKEEVFKEAGKMGKSLKNGIDPLEVCKEYSADTLRLYILYMGPLDAPRVWSQQDVIGMFRFLQRLTRLIVDENTGELNLEERELTSQEEFVINKTILKVEKDIDGLFFNTAIAQLIECVNFFVSQKTKINKETATILVKLISPFTPHLSEELWQKLGNDSTIVFADFPKGDESKVKNETITIPVQINGKIKIKLDLSPGLSQEELLDIAKNNEKIIPLLENKTIIKEIVIPDRMINIVIK